MALASEVVAEIETLVRGGFEAEDDIVDIVADEMFELARPERDEVRQHVARLQADHEAEKASWPAVTDCDRLDGAFRALGRLGVICLQNAGLTQSDGYDDFREALSRHPEPTRVQGYCFFQGQDLARAVNGHGLHLAFGPSDPRKEEEDGPRIGRLVTAELAKAGLNVVWAGTFDQRIFIPSMRWQKR